MEITVTSPLPIASCHLFLAKFGKMNAILSLVVCFSALVAAAPTDYDMGYDHAMTYAQPMTYAAPSYAAPSYDVHDVVSSIDSCYVNIEPI